MGTTNSEVPNVEEILEKLVLEYDIFLVGNYLGENYTIKTVQGVGESEETAIKNLLNRSREQGIVYLSREIKQLRLNNIQNGSKQYRFSTEGYQPKMIEE